MAFTSINGGALFGTVIPIIRTAIFSSPTVAGQVSIGSITGNFISYTITRNGSNIATAQTASTYTDTTLSNNTQYTYTIIPYIGGVCGIAFSAIINLNNAETPGQIYTLASINTISFKQITLSSVTLSASAIANNINIAYSGGSSDQVSGAAYPITGSPLDVLFTGMNSNTIYTFSVFPMNGDNYCPVDNYLSGSVATIQYVGTPYFTGSTNGTVMTLGTTVSSGSVYDYIYIYGVGQLSSSNILKYICHAATANAPFYISSSESADTYNYTVTPYKLKGTNTLPLSTSSPNIDDFNGTPVSTSYTINYFFSNIAAKTGTNNRVYEFLVSSNNSIYFNFPITSNIEYALVGGGGAGAKLFGTLYNSACGGGGGGEVSQGLIYINGNYNLSATIGDGGDSNNNYYGTSSTLNISNGWSYSATGGGLGDSVRSNVGGYYGGNNAGGSFWLNSTNASNVSDPGGFGWPGVNYGGGNGTGGGGAGGCGTNSNPQQHGDAALYTSGPGVKFISNSASGYTNIAGYYSAIYWGGGGGGGGCGQNGMNGGIGGGGGGGTSGGTSAGSGGGSAYTSGSSGTVIAAGNPSNGGAGGTNTGGGGGGPSLKSAATYKTSAGGNGGSGIVIVYIPIAPVSKLIYSSGINATFRGSGTYTLYSFTSTSGSITLTGSGNIYYIIVGGGGSAGSGTPATGAYAAGGGAGGGIRSGKIVQTSTTTYTISVGNGGTAPGAVLNGVNGSPSSISYSATTITAGGGGGNPNTTGGTSGGTTLGLTGIYGVSESGNSSNGGTGGSSTQTLLNTGTNVANISGYTVSIANPAFVGKYGSGGGGGNNGNSTPLNNDFGGGQGGTGNFINSASGLVNTGSGAGGNRSYTWWTGSSNTSTQVSSAATGGSGIVLLFY